MTQRRLPRALLVLALTAVAAGQAPEDLSRWRYFQEVPEGPAEGRAFLPLDAAALGGARADYADLRLFDAERREIPYALRVRRRERKPAIIPGKEFNRGVRGRLAELALDLGPEPVRHNEIEIVTAGADFRRTATVQTSDDAVDWFTVRREALLFHFDLDAGAVRRRTVSYPESRRRYIRALVEADPSKPGAGAPTILEATVQRVVEHSAVEREFPLEIVERRVEQDETPASVYRLSAAGPIPLQGLSLQFIEPELNRPYELRDLAGEQPRKLASGRLRRNARRADQPLRIRFRDVVAEDLELRILNGRNPPLTLESVAAISAERQLVFDAAAAAAYPLRLYFGNPEAIEPRYEIDAFLPDPLENPGVRLTAGARQENPLYEPPPEPLTERAPWLLYLALILASLALLGVILKLARTGGSKPA